MSHKYILLFSILFSGFAFSQEVKNTPTVTTRQVESPDNLATFYRDLSQSFNTRNFVGRVTCLVFFLLQLRKMEV